MSTINFDQTIFSEWYDDSNKSDIKYIKDVPKRIKHDIVLYKDIAIDNNPISHKTQSIKMISYGFPPQSHVKNCIMIGLDPNQQSCTKLNELLTRVDNFFSSFDVKYKLFGEHADYFTYYPLIRKDNEFNSKRFNFCKVKFIVDHNGDNMVIMNGKQSKVDESIISYGSQVIYTIIFNRIFVMHEQHRDNNLYGVELLMNSIDVESRMKIDFSNLYDFESVSDEE